MATSCDSLSRNHLPEQRTEISYGTSHERPVRPDPRNLSRQSRMYSRDRADTRECTDWLKETLAGYSAKEIAHLAGCSLRAAENAKRGDNGMNMANIVTFMRNDPAFRALFYAHGGGDGPETDPEFVVAMNMAMNSYARRRAASEGTNA